jgi:hypothetical protein
MNVVRLSRLVFRDEGATLGPSDTPDFAGGQADRQLTISSALRSVFRDDQDVAINSDPDNIRSMPFSGNVLTDRQYDLANARIGERASRSSNFAESSAAIPAAQTG